MRQRTSQSRIEIIDEFFCYVFATKNIDKEKKNSLAYFENERERFCNFSKGLFENIAPRVSKRSLVRLGQLVI